MSDTILAPQEVPRMLALQVLGWGAKRFSRDLGCSRNTVRQYLRQGGWQPIDVASRVGVLEPHRQWLAERLRQHRGNAEVVRHDLARELGIEVSLRTVQFPGDLHSTPERDCPGSAYGGCEFFIGEDPPDLRQR